jgi:hypothetical protein
MEYPVVTRSNLSDAVKIALSYCMECLVAATSTGNAILQRDLNVALSSLRLIDMEIENKIIQVRSIRSALFTRHVVDEGPSIQMDSELVDFVMKIEDVYRRHGFVSDL